MLWRDGKKGRQHATFGIEQNQIGRIRQELDNQRHGFEFLRGHHRFKCEIENAFRQRFMQTCYFSRGQMLPQDHQEIRGRRFQGWPGFRGIDRRVSGFEQNLEGGQFDGTGLKYESVRLVLDNATDNRFRQQRPQIFDETDQREILHALIVSSYIRRRTYLKPYRSR